MDSISEETAKALTSSMETLNRLMEKNNSAILQGNANLNNTKKQYNDIINSAQDLNQEFETGNTLISKAITGVKNLGQELLGSYKSAGLLFGGLTVGNVVKDWLNLQNTMTGLSVRMGKGREGTKDLIKTVNELSAEYGTAYENAKTFVKALSEAKYEGNIKEAAAGIDLFTRATDVSQESVIALTKHLSKSGGMDSKEINAIYASMTKAQQAVGISKNGMEALVETTQRVTDNMIAFGKSPQEIKKNISSITGLVASLEQVGVEASRSTQLIEDLLDPGKIEDNILLYSQLGISIEEAMSQDFNLDNMGGQLKDLAQRIVDMGPIAGNAFGKQMGLSFKEASKMIKMDPNNTGLQEAVKTTEEESLDALRSLTEATMGISGKFEDIMNKVEGRLRKLGPILLGLVAVFWPLITKKLKQSLEKLTGGISASVATGVNKGMANASVATEEGIGSSVAGGFKKGFDKAEGLFGTLLIPVKKLGDGVGGVVDKVTADSTSKIQKALEKGIKGGRLEQTTKANIINMADSIKQDKQDVLMVLDNLEKELPQIDFSKVFNEEDFKKFKEGKLASLGDGAAEFKRQLEEAGVALPEAEKIQSAFSESLEKTSKAMELLNERSTGIADKYFDQDIDLEKAAELLKIQSGSRKIADEISESKSLERKYLGEIKDLEEAAAKSTSDKEAKTASLNNLNKKISNLEKQGNNLSSKKKAQLKDLCKQRDKEKLLVEAAKNLDEENKKALENKNKELAQEIKNRQDLVDLQQQSKGLEVNGGKSVFGKAANAIKTGIRSKWQNSGIYQAYNETSKKTGSKGLGIAAGTLKGLGGAFKSLSGLAKAAGAIGIAVTLIMKMFKPALQKAQETLMPVLESIGEVICDNLFPVIEPLLPLITDLIKTVVKTLFPPVLKLLSGILKVINVFLAPVKAILGCLEKIPGIGPIFKGINQTLKGLETMPDALCSAADNISNNFDSALAEKQKKEEEFANSQDEPPTITASGGNLIARENTVGDKVSVASPVATSTVQKIEYTDDKKEEDVLEKIKKDESEKRDVEYKDSVKNDLSAIAKLFKVTYELIAQGANKSAFDAILNSPAETINLTAKDG